MAASFMNFVSDWDGFVESAAISSLRCSAPGWSDLSAFVAGGAEFGFCATAPNGNARASAMASFVMFVRRIVLIPRSSGYWETAVQQQKQQQASKYSLMRANAAQTS